MNLYIKLIGAVCVVACSTGAGFLLSERLRQRTVFLKAFDCFLSALETNIRYNSDEIIALIESSAPSYLRVYMDFEQADLFALWQSFLKSLPKTLGLREEDYELLCGFGERLGSTDIEGQLCHIKLYREMNEKNYDNSINEYKNSARIYKLLGFFVGAAISIMIL